MNVLSQKMPTLALHPGLAPRARLPRAPKAEAGTKLTCSRTWYGMKRLTVEPRNEHAITSVWDLDEAATVLGRAKFGGPLLSAAMTGVAGGVAVGFGTLPALSEFRESLRARPSMADDLKTVQEALTRGPVRAVRKNWRVLSQQITAEQRANGRSIGLSLLAGLGTFGMALGVWAGPTFAGALLPGVAAASLPLLYVAVPLICLWAVGCAVRDGTAALQAHRMLRRVPGWERKLPRELRARMIAHLRGLRLPALVGAVGSMLLAVGAPLALLVSPWGLLLHIPGMGGLVGAGWLSRRWVDTGAPLPLQDAAALGGTRDQVALLQEQGAFRKALVDWPYPQKAAQARVEAFLAQFMEPASEGVDALTYLGAQLETLQLTDDFAAVALKKWAPLRERLWDAPKFVWQDLLDLCPAGGEPRRAYLAQVYECADHALRHAGASLAKQRERQLLNHLADRLSLRAG